MASEITATFHQRRIVHLLTSGSRMSLRRAWAAAGYNPSHNSSWSQLLASPVICQLFGEAIAAGRPVPWKQEKRIFKAVVEQDVRALS